MSKKISVYTAIATALALTSGMALADDHPGMEQCKVVKDGKGLIKEHKGDCKAGTHHSCAGQNPAGDPESWILVPTGQCDVINKWINNVKLDIKDKIETTK